MRHLSPLLSRLIRENGKPEREEAPHVLDNYELENELRAEYRNRNRRPYHDSSGAAAMRFSGPHRRAWWFDQYREALDGIERWGRKPADPQMTLNL